MAYPRFAARKSESQTKPAQMRSAGNSARRHHSHMVRGKHISKSIRIPRHLYLVNGHRRSRLVNSSEGLWMPYHGMAPAPLCYQDNSIGVTPLHQCPPNALGFQLNSVQQGRIHYPWTVLHLEILYEMPACKIQACLLIHVWTFSTKHQPVEYRYTCLLQFYS